MYRKWKKWTTSWAQTGQRWPIELAGTLIRNTSFWVGERGVREGGREGGREVGKETGREGGR